MKCFYDPAQDAVGTCKSCGRGLSRDHLVDMGKGLACKGRCEEDVRSLIEVIDRSIASSATTNQILKRGSATGYGSGVFLMLMGVVFLITGTSRPNLEFVFYLGVGFLVYGLWSLARAYRYAKLVARLPDSDGSDEAGK